MEKSICVRYVEPIDGHPNPDRESLLKVDPSPGVQKAPAPDPESTRDDDSVFTPNLDLVLP
jgi:hypothetical protein